ncbi:pyrophosphate--fructose 6-phosphate 1-phosphotransferase subunit beta-like [Aristolochia californica]|uniref:pyrophosphate--fructose 6-phosphate 1-phosphotransferase subunit beta-like n=1 Tax=Aristolochia californica TaxID=171875 RepID=UPI0035D953D0
MLGLMRGLQKKYYHFVRLMERAASHITVECALQTHPNITIIGEEVAAKKQNLKNVTDCITNIIYKRAVLGYNYGVILISKDLIGFIPEVQQLIAELNEILGHDVVVEGGLWKKKLRHQSQLLFEILPKAIQEQLMLERDPHGNVLAAKIETEKMLISMVETELDRRKLIGQYLGQFKGQFYFFGYEGRCGLPTNFDTTYCYALGYDAGSLLHFGKTGLISSVANLGAPVEQWTVGGTTLTSLMDVERRHGKFKAINKKAIVELGACISKVLFCDIHKQTNAIERVVGLSTRIISVFHSDAISRFEEHLQILELSDIVIFTAAYKPMLTIQSILEECEIVNLCCAHISLIPWVLYLSASLGVIYVLVKPSQETSSDIATAKSDLNHIGLLMQNILVQQLGIARRGTLSMESTTITAEAACGFHKDLQMGATKAIVQYESQTDPKVEISIVTLAPQPAEAPILLQNHNLILIVRTYSGPSLCWVGAAQSRTSSKEAALCTTVSNRQY